MRFVMTSSLQASYISLGIFSSQRRRVNEQFLSESQIEMDLLIHSCAQAFSQYPSGGINAQRHVKPGLYAGGKTGVKSLSCAQGHKLLGEVGKSIVAA